MSTFGMWFSGILISLMYGCMYAFPTAAVLALIGWLLDKLFTAIYGKDNDKGEELWNMIFFVCCAMAIIVLLGASFYSGLPQVFIEAAKWEEPYNYVTHEIINLADNNEIEGHIRGRYVRGYIGETTTYHCYYKQNDGGMKLQQAGEKTTTIYYTDGEPRAEWYSQTRRFWWNEETRHFCRIYIPEGTMTTEFEIDMN